MVSSKDLPIGMREFSNKIKPSRTSKHKGGDSTAPPEDESSFSSFSVNTPLDFHVTIAPKPPKPTRCLRPTPSTTVPSTQGIPTFPIGTTATYGVAIAPKPPKRKIGDVESIPPKKPRCTETNDGMMNHQSMQLAFQLQHNEFWTLHNPPKMPLKNQPRQTKVGRPRKDPSTIARNRIAKTMTDRATTLRKDKPVVVGIPLDIWQHIFGFCTPGFLLKARTVCRTFMMATDLSSTWRSSRLHTYGFDCPDPPAGLTEMQYADLIASFGCQVKGCPNQKCHKIYWAFQRRWCEKCVQQRITTNQASLAFSMKYPRLFDCIFHFTFDKWDKYQCTGSYTVKPVWIKSPGDRIGYERGSISQAMREIDEIVTTKTEAEQNAWYEEKIREKNALVTDLQKVESFFETWKRENDERKEMKKERIRFFEVKAGQLNPPLDPEALRLLAPFQRAIIVNRKASERCWEVLQPKIEAERDLAEKIMMEKRATRLERAEPRYLTGSLLNRQKRTFTTPPELETLLTVAGDTIRRLGFDDAWPNGVAVQDVVPFLLKEIYRAYHRLNLDATPRGEDGLPYRLVLEDSFAVYRQKIEPIINRLPPEKRKLAKRLKCPGCTRKDVHLRYEYTALMDHVLRRHADGSVGDFSIWRMLPKQTWESRRYEIKWPNNLPILAEHHIATGRWDPHDTSNYLRTPSTVVQTRVLDAFRDRYAASEKGYPAPQFVNNVIYAASELHKSSLDPKLKTLIVFNFAMQKHRRASAMANTEPGSPPAFEVLNALHLELMGKGFYDLFEGFRCKHCSENRGEFSKPNKYTTKDQALGDLIQHYSSGGHPRSTWPSSMFTFPTATELSAALSVDAQAFRIFDKLFPRTGTECIDPAILNNTTAF